MKILLALILNFILITTGNNLVAAQTTPSNSVDLLWEGGTSVPSFYIGRPLPSAGSLVRVVAIPNIIKDGRKLATTDLVFKWVKDRYSIQSASGTGKDVLEYTADVNGAASDISVEILTSEGELVAKAQTTITSVAQKVILYPDGNPTNSLRPQPLGTNTVINTTENTFSAQPFFFSQLDLVNRRVVFEWRINGEQAPAQREDSQLFTVAAPDQGQGEVELTIIAKNERVPRQTASQTVNLNFGRANFNF